MPEIHLAMAYQWRLTVKLSGRPRELRAHQSAFAQHADETPSLTTAHGPLQRLLEYAFIGATVHVRHRCGKATRHSLALSAPLRWERSHSAPGA